MFDVQASIGRVHILKPDYGSDLLKELQKYVLANHINLAWLSGVGAVSKANIRYYDQPVQKWIDLELDQKLEVAGMWGNVSLLNGEPLCTSTSLWPTARVVATEAIWPMGRWSSIWRSC